MKKSLFAFVAGLVVASSVWWWAGRQVRPPQTPHSTQTEASKPLPAPKLTDQIKPPAKEPNFSVVDPVVSMQGPVPKPEDLPGLNLSGEPPVFDFGRGEDAEPTVRITYGNQVMESPLIPATPSAREQIRRQAMADLARRASAGRGAQSR